MKSWTNMSQHKHLWALITAIVVLIGMGGCDHGFQQLNTNPTQVTNMNAKYLFPTNELKVAGGRYKVWRMDLIHLEEWVQQLSSPSWGADRYIPSDGYATAYWQTAYTNYVQGIQDIIKQLRTDSTANSNQLAIAKIWRVYIFSRITDVFGDIPYTQAGTGLTSQIYQPKYDTQQAIYTDMISQLEAATSELDPNKASWGENDIIYNGDIGKWKRFGNSLLMRLGMHLSKVDPAAAKAAVSKAFSGGVMMSNDDNCYIAQYGQSSQGILRSGIGEVFNDFGVTGHGFRCSDELINRMKQMSDPRMFIYAGVYNNNGDDVTPADPDSMMGLQNGLPADSLTNVDTYNFAQPNRDIMVRYDSPTVFMTYAEVSFLEAEAAHRGWISGGESAAQTYYNDGVTAALKMLTIYSPDKAVVTDTQVSNYLSQPYVDYNSAKDYDVDRGAGTVADVKLDKIITQKWLALYLNGFEAYIEWRRTGYPVLTPVNYNPDALQYTNGTIPRRVMYPTEEQSLNGTNYQEAVGRLSGGDKETSRIWIDPQK